MSSLRRNIRRRHDQDGALAIEFALIAPLVLLMAFAVVQFGLALNAWQGVHAAAREGARVGSISTSTAADIQAHIVGALDGVAINNPSIPPPVPGTCANRSGGLIEVRVSGTTTIDIPFIGPAFEVPLSGRGQFRCE